jgi:hypothetical protein
MSLEQGDREMKPEEHRVRDSLATLAASDSGRSLLQLGLRGIQRGELGVTAGCWVQQGSAGCLFQHAYWQGVREGVFADAGRPGDWIGSFVGPRDYGLVIRVIDAFDRLARSTYAEIKHRALLPDLVVVRQDEWRQAVERFLVDALGDPQAELSTDKSRVAAIV